MKFLSKRENTERYVDNIFSVVGMAGADKEGINATAGCLYDEQGRLFTFDCVREVEKQLTPQQKAAYAASPAGNSEYLEEISARVLAGKVSNHHITVASAGGTGAIYMAIATCLDDGDTILYPQISWGNYRVFTDEHNLHGLTYDVYDLDDLFQKIDEASGKLFLIINSPCENPLGQTYTFAQWQQIMARLNKQDREVVLLCDIAYIDYAHGDQKDYFTLFNEINDNVLVLLAASCSKAFSYYGQRLGALIAINNDPEFLDLYLSLCSRLARVTWSNLNNAGMLAIGKVLKEHKAEYEAELDAAKAMLKKRTDLFIRQADECALEYYKFADGFFVTLKMTSNEYRDEVFRKLLEAHIYTICVNKGIRLGLCSVPLDKIDGLAKRIKELM